MIEGKLSNGFEIKISDENFDDYELFEDLVAIDENSDNVGKIVSVYKRLLGDKQYNALKEHLRKKNGKVSRDAMFNTLAEIFALNDESKNS